jgi:hypothetical protein
MNLNTLLKDDSNSEQEESEQFSEGDMNEQEKK